MLLAVTRADVHGTASALAVVARTVGMLVGLSLLTAVALRRFTAEVAAIGSPSTLCPDSPADCAAYDAATEAAVLTQLHTVFAGAAVAAALAAVAALVLLREVRTPARPDLRAERAGSIAAVGEDLHRQPLALAQQAQGDVTVGDVPVLQGEASRSESSRTFFARGLNGMWPAPVAPCRRAGSSRAPGPNAASTRSRTASRSMPEGVERGGVQVADQGR